VFKAQQFDSFDQKRSDSPKNAAIAAEFCLLTFPSALLGAVDATTGTRSRSDETAPPPGGVTLRGAAK
jgi:hypothetical protein